MYSIKFSSSILSLIFSIVYALENGNKPIIAVTQGVIKNKNLFPISVFWWHPNFAEGDLLLVDFSNNRTEYSGRYKIESYTGFFELPAVALKRSGSLDEYCVAVRSKGITLLDNPSCKSKLQWMYDRQDVLGSFRLTDLIIPGTHHSAAYAKSDNESLNAPSVMSRWIFSQTKSIKTQLMDGIRYLDLRPGSRYIAGKKEYIITHGRLDLISMADAVEQIIEFMALSQDIVIVSFTGFSEEFNSNEDHEDFVGYLEFSFAGYAHPRRVWDYTLNQFWAAGKRLILSYDHDAYKTSHYMWPPIPQYWADVQTIAQLHSHLNTLHRAHANDARPYAAMVGFTHSIDTVTRDIFINTDTNLRLWTGRLSRYIPQWYTEEWNATANIIAVDFYQSSGIVDIAIQLNGKRARDPKYHKGL